MSRGMTAPGLNLVGQMPSVADRLASLASNVKSWVHDNESSHLI